MTAALDLVGLRRHYGDVHAVDGVDLSVARGERFALLGPSGSGKTTVLRLVAGFLAPDAGEVRIDGRDVTHLPPERRGVGVVFQDYALFPHRTVAENIAFGLRMRRMPRAERRDRVAAVVDLVGLGREVGRRPHELSGGQQQRVALARALAPEPALLLLDEPLANLDRRLRDALREELVSTTEAVGITSVLVTHDQEEALSFAHRLGVLRDGRLVQAATPEQVWRAPADAFVARFLGDTNLLPLRGAPRDGQVEVTGVEGSLEVDGDLPAPASAGEVLACLRPESLRLERASGGGTVAAVAYAGGSATYEVQVGACRVRVRVPQPDGTTALAVGDAVRVVPVVARVRLLAGDGPARSLPAAAAAT